MGFTRYLTELDLPSGTRYLTELDLPSGTRHRTEVDLPFGTRYRTEAGLPSGTRYRTEAGLSFWSDSMSSDTASIRARCVKACGKLPRCSPVAASISSA